MCLFCQIREPAGPGKPAAREAAGVEQGLPAGARGRGARLLDHREGEPDGGRAGRRRPRAGGGDAEEV